MTMSNEIFVAFATQKGGIGKSTITALAANYLHNVKGYNVAVIDCDAPQHSIYGLRERETKLIDESRYFKALACEHFRKLKRNAYPVIASDAVNALDDAEKLNKQLRRFRTPSEYERIQAEILASCPIRSNVQGDLI